MDEKILPRRNVWLKILYFNIYLFIQLEFFSKLHSDRTVNTFTCFRQRGEYQNPSAQLVY